MSFAWLAKPFPRKTNWTDFYNVTADSCVYTIYSAEYRVCPENKVAYVFIALLCLATVDLIGTLVKHFLDCYFAMPFRKQCQTFSQHTLDESLERIARR